MSKNRLDIISLIVLETDPSDECDHDGADQVQNGDERRGASQLEVQADVRVDVSSGPFRAAVITTRRGL